MNPKLVRKIRNTIRTTQFNLVLRLLHRVGALAISIVTIENDMHSEGRSVTYTMRLRLWHPLTWVIVVIGSPVIALTSRDVNVLDVVKECFRTYSRRAYIKW